MDEDYRKIVYICSPYRAETKEELEQNIATAKQAARAVIHDYGIPIVPHLYFTQFLDEGKERSLGMKMGIQLLGLCDEIWVVGDRITEGMKGEIRMALINGVSLRLINEKEYMTVENLIMEVVRGGPGD